MLDLIREEINKFISNDDFLNEGVTDVIYHFTYSKNTLNILKNNTINLAPVTGTGNYDFKINRGKFYYLSLTRSKHMDVGYGSGNSRIMMDGKRINQNFKTISVDYWGRDRDPKKYDKKAWGDGSSLYKQISKNHEQEDRIATNRSKIDNANKYILEIDLLIRDGFDNDLKYAEEIKYYCDKYGISLNVYNNDKDFNYSIKKNRINIIPKYHDIESERNYGEALPYGFIEIISHITYKREDKLDYFINKFKEFGFNDDKINKIKEKISKEWYNIKLMTRYGDYERDSILSFSGKYIDKQNHNPLYRFAVNELIKDIRKDGYSDIKDYLNNIGWRGKKRKEVYQKTFYDNIVNLINKRFNELIEENIKHEFHYYSKDGERGDNIFEDNDILNLLNKWKNILIDYYKRNILNNSDIWNYNWFYSSWHVAEDIGLKESNEFDILINNKFDDVDYVDSNYLKYNIIKTIMSDVEEYGNKVWDNMKKDYFKQL